MLKMLAQEERTIIFYESPHRLVKTLKELAVIFGAERQAAVCRELTKIFEETNKNTLAALAAHYEKHPPKGEIVMVIEGATATKRAKYAEQETEDDEEEDDAE